MIKKHLISAILFSAMALGSIVASAATANYTFGNLLSGTFTPSGSFASLAVTTTDNTTYDFTLTAFSLDSLFTSGAFIGSMAVDTTFAHKEALPSAALTGLGNGVTSVGTSNGGGPTGVWDFRYDFGGGSDRLTGLETVFWTSTFATAHTFDGNQFALHIQGLTDDQGDSAWYTPSRTPPPVPLPAAAWLFGSALLGFVALSNRRRV